MRNRYKYAERDFVKLVTIREVKVYDGKTPGKARTKFVIESSSWPQYYPYFTKKDSRGRTRTYQRTYRHQYDVTIQLDRLSINVPFKGRTGADRVWRFNSKTIKNSNTQKLEESENIKLGINGDFFFRCSFVWKDEGILFGRNYANGPPVKVNPKNIVFADKHFLNAVTTLMRMGVLKDD